MVSLHEEDCHFRLLLDSRVADGDASTPDAIRRHLTEFCHRAERDRPSLLWSTTPVTMYGLSNALLG